VEKTAFVAFEAARKSNENDDYKASENKYKEVLNIQGLPELADQNNTVKSLSSGNNRKNI
jgi:ABC-type multidrug transport system ATPase subunit